MIDEYTEEGWKNLIWFINDYEFLKKKTTINEENDPKILEKRIEKIKN